MDHFKLHSEYQPTGDQPQDYRKLVKGLRRQPVRDLLVSQLGKTSPWQRHRPVKQANFGTCAQ